MLRLQSSLKTLAKALSKDSNNIKTNGILQIQYMIIFATKYTIPFFVNSWRLSGILANCKIDQR